MAGPDPHVRSEAGQAAPSDTPAVDGKPVRWGARIGLILGPVLMAVALAVGRTGDAAMWHTAGLAAWMAVWWATDALPLGVTGLLPLVMVPLIGAGSTAQAAAPYGSPVLFLFLGGFWLAAGVQRWRLHERIAFWTAGVVGLGPKRIVGGFMLATAFLSMWMSNTAAVLLMLPMGVSVVELMGDDPRRVRFGRALMLGIAYAGSIGGLATLIGTPPNALLAAYVEQDLGRSIDFAQWMLWALPLAAVGLVLTWLLLTRVLFRVSEEPVAGGRDAVVGRLRALGPVGRPEIRVAVIFLLVALGWLASPLLEDRIPWPGDPAIAVIGALLLFVVPAGLGRRRPLLVWDEALRIPWGVLLLFGGGLSLAAAMDRTGLADRMGRVLADASGGDVVLLLAGATLLSLVLTEFMSNTASAAILLPVLASVAQTSGLDPYVLLVPATLMASCGFMMPAGTPPNAIAVGSGHVEARVMVRTGVWVNLLFLGLVVLHGLFLGRVAF